MDCVVHGCSAARTTRARRRKNPNITRRNGDDRGNSPRDLVNTKSKLRGTRRSPRWQPTRRDILWPKFSQMMLELYQRRLVEEEEEGNSGIKSGKAGKTKHDKFKTKFLPSDWTLLFGSWSMSEPIWVYFAAAAQNYRIQKFEIWGAAHPKQICS